MEGLDASLIAASNLERTSRLDAPYYSQVQLSTMARLSSLNVDSVSGLTAVSDGNHFSISESFLEEGGIPYYRGQDVVGHFFIEHAAPIQITRDAYSHRHMQRSHLRNGDVLLSIVGSIGELSLVGDSREATCSCKLAILRPRTIAAGYLAAFLKSRYGRTQIARLTRGAVQMSLLLEDMDQLFVARIPSIEEAVANAIGAAGRGFRDSAEALRSAEERLIRALQLEDMPLAPLSFTRSASDALAAGRLDATYFSPAKQNMLDALGRLPGATLGDRYDSVRRMFNPLAPGEVTEVRDYDLPDALRPLLDDSKVPEPVSAIGSVKKRLAVDDVVISRLRAYLKEVAIVRAPDGVTAVGSSEFIVLRRKSVGPELSPETLLTFLRSDPVQTILKYCQDGSHHPRFNEADLLGIPLPDVLSDVSPEITREVQAALTAQHRARRLLDAAVRAIEIAIDDSEAAALAHIEQVLR